MAEQPPGPSSKDKPLPKTIHQTTIRNPPWSYLHLELISTAPSSPALDELTTRTNLTAALSQFLGLTGTAIPIDILKVEEQRCWVRVPTADLPAVVAAVGGWTGRAEGAAEVGWRVVDKGKWLGELLGARAEQLVWKS
ncbi:MAG: hypothetical protein M1825_004449 [Sarcosagium campestre]|nr:MAG: hypothetical protein M1825_004449 [Sarcosagium campestre]